MQVGSHIYADIEIPDLNLKDFLAPEDVYALEIIETAGTSLPGAFVVFKTLDEKVMNSIQENNEIIIKIGSSSSDADSFPVTIINKDVQPDPSNAGWVVSFTGFLYGKEYMVSQENEVYTGNSLLVAKDVIKEYFGKNIKTNIKKVNEKQVTWRRNNKSACSFLVDVLLHMDIRPSFPLFAFDKYGNFILKSFDSVVAGDPAFRLVPRTPSKLNEIQYLNNFSLDNYKDSYNLYSGYNRQIENLNATKGGTSYTSAENEPLLAATSTAEKSNSGNTITVNNIQSTNVHDTYKEAFDYNTNKLVLLSSVGGEVTITGRYYSVLAPLDLIYLETDDSMDGEALCGPYLIDTISTSVNFSSGAVVTKLYITRDNKNYIENYVKPKDLMNILKSALNKVCAAVHDLKVAYAFGLRIIDGTYMQELLSFAIATKRNLLRSFSIAGVPIDFNSQSALLQSLICTGNSLMNTLLDMIFPESIATTLRDFIITKPTLIGVISKYVGEFVPSELRDIVMSIVNSLFNVTDSLNSIAKDNGIQVTTQTVTKGDEAKLSTTEETSEIDYKEEGQGRVDEVITEFENNATGLDIPYPIIELTESQALMSDEELRNYLAITTIENLTNLGYIKSDEDASKLKEILLGNEKVDFNLIDSINKNAGNSLNYRYWGVFGETKEALYAWTYEDKTVYTKQAEVQEKSRLYNNDYSPYARIEFKITQVGKDKYIVTYNGEPAERDEDKDVISDALAELTSFNIKQSYKDKYRTIPCTKIINASQNQRVYFACPQREKDLRFFINAKREDLKSFEIDLGYKDQAGLPVMYNVYYTEMGFNSNSVLFEVRKGGII